MFQKMLLQAHCLNDQKEIVDEKLFHAFMSDKLDVKILCTALGK